MIVFFGWGRKAKEAVVSPYERLLMTYRYFHLFWIFTAAWGRQYQLATFTEQGWAVMPIDADAAAARMGGVLPDIHPWWRYSLVGVIGIGVAMVVLSALVAFIAS